MSQKGADLVVFQHSHCIGCYEKYVGSTLVYGQGNFIFDDSESESWQTSLLIKVCISDGLKVEYIPILKTGNTVTLADNAKAGDIQTAFHQCSTEIVQNGFIEQHYRQFAQENRASYLRKFFGSGKWMSRIDRRLLNGMLTKRKCNKSQLLIMRNYIECEAHRELVLAGLKGDLQVK